MQEENKILEKTNRQKVFEVEKLSQTVMELEEAILAGGAAANTIRDYRRQISELNVQRLLVTYISYQLLFMLYFHIHLWLNKILG